MNYSFGILRDPVCRRRFDELHDAVLALGYVVSSVPLDATMVERIEGEVRGSDWRLLRWSRPAIEGGLSMLPPLRRSATLRRSQPCSCSTSRKRKTAKVVFGAPPDLHEQIGKMLSGLMR
jgi:hypothetical protein